jgi:hypothetical protein
MADSGARKQPRGRPPFEPGHQLALKHGCSPSAKIVHQARAIELADYIRPQIPGFQDGDEIALELMCLSLCRIESGNQYLDKANNPWDKRHARLLHELRAQTSQVQKWLDVLGLTPTSRARLMRDLADTHSVVYRDQLRQRYGGGAA